MMIFDGVVIVIFIEDVDSFFYKLTATDEHKYVLNDIVDFFSIFDPSVVHTYEYKNKLTDGRTRFVNPASYEFLIGLKQRIVIWLEKYEYPYEDKTTRIELDKPIPPEVGEYFFDRLGLDFKPHDFQPDMFIKALYYKRIILWSAVGSGKSLVIYALTRFFNKKGKKVLVLTPDLMLKNQLYNDFIDYHFTRRDKLLKALENTTKEDQKLLIQKKIDEIESNWVEDHCEDFESVWTTIDDKKELYEDHNVKIINFQSLIRLLENDPEWFKQFDAIIVDEVHKAGSAGTYYDILEAMDNCTYRIGFTGTKPSDTIVKYTLDGLFGHTRIIVTLQDLVKRGLATPFEIQPLELVYPESDVDQVWNVLGLPNGSRKMTWMEEAKFVRLHRQSRTLIVRMAIKLCSSGTNGSPTIILVKNRDAQKLFKEILDELGFKNYYVINGDVKAKDRENIRQLMQKGGDIILIGGEKILSTGINIPSLTYIIKLQGKAELELIQALGRSTRKHEHKTKAIMFDIIDNLRYVGKRGGKKDNYHIKHWKERKKVYESYNIKPNPIKQLRVGESL